MINEKLKFLDKIINIKYAKPIVIKLYANNKISYELNTKFTYLKRTNKMYRLLIDYLNRTKIKKQKFIYNVLDIFEIEQINKKTSEKYLDEIGNKTLLFYGTDIKNISGILKNGLMINSEEKRICFSNCSTKSIQDCLFHNQNGKIYLFVAEVALGNILKTVITKYGSNGYIEELPPNYDSEWIIGRNSIEIFHTEDNDLRIPSGKICKVNINNEPIYDEFIIYNERQINLIYYYIEVCLK